MALYDTAGTVVSDVALELGLGAIADPFASSSANAQQLCGLLKSTGRRLVLQTQWTHLTREATFTTDPGTNSYPLPADFASMIDQTGWSRTTRFPIAGPMTPQEWQYMKARVVGFALTVLFRPRETAIEVWPQPPPGGLEIAYEYRSRYWVQSSGAPSPDKDAPTLSSDVVKLDGLLVTRALKVAWLQAKGFDSAAALADYQETWDRVRSAEKASAPVLSLNGSSMRDRLLDIGNSPATGFGFDGEGGLL